MDGEKRKQKIIRFPHHLVRILNDINLSLSLLFLLVKLFPFCFSGDKHVISLLDFFGFENSNKNEIGQLFVNSLNEQLQNHYIQKIFVRGKVSVMFSFRPLI